MVTLECHNCSISYQVSKKRAKSHEKLGRKLNFCSQTCLHSHQKTAFSKARVTKLSREIRPDGMSKCSNCGLKPNEEFGMKDGGKRLQSLCKRCLYKAQTERWVNIKKKAIEYKGGKCFDCSLVDSHVVYDFHHKDPTTKEFEWHKLKIKKWSSIVNELDKCDLLCSNCHRKRHSTGTPGST